MRVLHAVIAAKISVYIRDAYKSTRINRGRDGCNELDHAVTASARELRRLPPGEGIPSAPGLPAWRPSEDVLASRGVLMISQRIRAL